MNTATTLNFSGIGKVFSATILAVTLTACGGGGGGGSEPTPPPVSISHPVLAGGIKGPLANADVVVNQLALNQAGLKGSELLNTRTDSKAVIQRVSLTAPFDEFYLVEFRSNASTIDLSTGKAPVMPTLTTVVSKGQLESGTTVYATPMTTLVLRVVEQAVAKNPGASFSQYTAQATQSVIAELGFGFSLSGDLFSLPGMITADADLQTALQYRSSNEAISALLFSLRDSSGLSMDQLLSTFAKDLVDSRLDALSGTETISYGQLSNPLEAINNAAIAWLPIPETDQDGRPTSVDPFLVGNTANLMVREMTATGIQRDVSAITSGQLRYQPTPRGADLDNDGYPDAVDNDDDNDGVDDVNDAFPRDAAEALDTDGDGVGNNADNDDDNDGVSDSDDALPLDAAESVDTDGDGIGNNADNDDDNDGVPDQSDAFPLDRNETTDSDNDGVGDNSDAYPTQAECHRIGDGDGENCYLKTLVTQGYDKLLHDHNGVSYFLSNSRQKIYRLAATGSQFLTPITMDMRHGNVTHWAWSSNHGKLYLGHANGAVTSILVQTELVERDFKQMGSTIVGLKEAGRYLLIQYGDNYWPSNSLVHGNGTITQTSNWSYNSNHYAWSASNNRLYHFADGISPNDLYFKTIDQNNGTFGANGESPYHGSYNIVGPIRVSSDGSKILLGSGDLYSSSGLLWQGNIGGSIFDAAWSSSGELVIVKQQNTDTFLVRRNAAMKQVESLSFSGQPLSIVALGGQYKLITKNANRLFVHTYTPSNDTDGDGVNNEEDAFPTDPAASIDSDGDGYPDRWNDAKGASDSNSGLTLDAFPNDSACWFSQHGIDGQCNYSATLPEFTPDQVFQTADETIHLYSKTHGKIFRWSPVTESYLNPYSVGIHEGILTIRPERVSYSSAHQRIYLGYNNGQIRYLELDNPVQEKAFAATAMANTGLAAAGNFVMASDNSGAWHTHYVFNQNGTLTDSAEWNYYSPHWTWDSTNSRMYFLRANQYPNDLHYEQISQSNGEIVANGETPYHGDYPITGPIRVNASGAIIALGSGHLYNGNGLTHLRALNVPFKDARWSLNQFVTATINNSNTDIALWTADAASKKDVLVYQGTPLSMSIHNDDIILITSRNNRPAFDRIVLADRDSDGIPGWWESKFGLSDNNAGDAQLDPDSDGLNNLQEFQQRTLPNNADTDSDGLSDGDEVNIHQSNPLVADSDGDGLTDSQEVNIYLTSPINADSDGDTLSDGAEVNQHQTNPLQADSDGDGLRDDWEVANGTDPNVNDAATDADGDGLSNLEEQAAGTDPNDADTDKDDLNDGDELNIHGSNPLSDDSDNDYMTDGWEVANSLSATQAADADTDSDGDGFSNREEFFGKTDPSDAADFPRATAWNTHQGNASHNGYVPLELDSTQFSLRWSKQFSDVYEGKQVATADASIIVSLANVNRLVVLDAIDGNERWSFSQPNHWITPPATSGNTVYLSASDGGSLQLKGFSVADGSNVFSTTHNGYFGSYIAPTVHDGSVFQPAWGVGLYRFDASNGSQQWVSNVESYNSLAVAVDDNYVYRYVSGNSDALKVYNRSSGAIEFTIADPDYQHFGSYGQDSTVLGHDAVYAINSGRVIKFDTKTRRIAWSVAGSHSGQPTVANETVFVIENGTLKALDIRTGNELWRHSATDSYGTYYGNIVATRNLVFVRNSMGVSAINRQTHQRVWTYPEAGELAISNEGAIIISGYNGKITVIDYAGDQDGDGLPSWWEDLYGLNDQDPSDAALDGDSDGLSNLQEFQNRTSPLLSDTDADGLSDGDEVLTHLSNPRDRDSDDDGLNDSDEVNVHNTSPIDADSDDDGLSDGVEINDHHTDPLSADSDSDGMEDGWEVSNGFDPNADDASLDSDGDGLSNLGEHTAGSDPHVADTDGDQLSDGDEVHVHGSNPVLADTDDDFINDGWEVANGFSPTTASDATEDADSDSFNNKEEYFGKTDPNNNSDFPIATAWQTFQGNASRTGYLPLTLNVNHFNLRWTRSQVGEYGVGQVATDTGRIFVTMPQSKKLLALNAASGLAEWEYVVTADSIDAPATGNGKVYFQTSGHGNSFLRAINANNGTLAYSTAYGNQWSSYLSPALYAGNVYMAGGYYGGTYAFNAENGTQQWFNSSTGQYDNWTPAVDDQYVFVHTGYSSNSLKVLDRSTGTLAFEITDPNHSYGWSSHTTAVVGVDAAFTINGARLVKHDLIKRQIAWASAEGVSGQPTLANEMVLVLKNGRLQAFDVRDGSELWSWAPNSQYLQSNIVATRNLVFVGDSSNTYAIDRSTQQQVWSYPATGSIAISNEGAIIITNSNGTITVINASGDEDSDGLPDWWETTYGFNPNDASDASNDDDMDGLTNLEEFANHTHPTDSDSDNDGLSDGEEVNTHQTNPNDSDSDDDDLTDEAEVNAHNTDPNNYDSDSDGFSDGQEVNQYLTDPNDANSRPSALSNFVQSFEGNTLPAGWTNAQGSQSNWTLDTVYASAGTKSLRSGVIPHNGTSGVKFEGVFAPSTLSFKYRTETESCCDRLRVYVDGVERMTASGTNNWTLFTLNLTAGEHVIEWRYTKDGSVVTGQDAVWLDEVTLTNN
ncbi:hypothetical protein E2H98_09365 [Permianibacter aggregans]|uniref:Outer membrane protein assembly factor BamB n=2 Tax=Permianibacter aggregans TaxID=1510150 RepID=A0A4R6U6D3_9GAMM|nr:hypothetical protein E2H98_09365 [Permianibacter aggregans]TDQ41821.1 outer membrane protein assembly factor BamB [Permianibacter aggregans]